MISNILSGIGANRASNAYADEINSALPQLRKDYEMGMRSSVEGYQPYANQGRASLADLASWRPEQMGQFQYNKDVNSFLDPSMEFQQQQMRAAQAESAAGHGRSLGGSAQKELAQLQANLSQTDYANSYNRMENDRQSVYSQFLNEFNAKNQASQARLGQLSGLVNTGLGAQGQISNAQQGIANNQYESGLYGAQANAQADASNASFGWDLAGGLVGTGEELGMSYLTGGFGGGAGVAPQQQQVRPQYSAPAQMQMVQGGMNPNLFQQQNTMYPPSGNVNLNTRFNMGR